MLFTPRIFARGATGDRQGSVSERADKTNEPREAMLRGPVRVSEVSGLAVALAVTAGAVGLRARAVGTERRCPSLAGVHIRAKRLADAAEVEVERGLVLSLHGGGFLSWCVSGRLPWNPVRVLMTMANAVGVPAPEMRKRFISSQSSDGIGHVSCTIVCKP